MVSLMSQLRSQVDSLRDALISDGFSVSCIHGGLSRSERQKAYEDFKNVRTTFLIASDIYARGVDFPMVTTVISLGVPMTKSHGVSEPDYETYLHRNGRTGRAGRRGISVTLTLSLKDEEAIRDIQAHFACDFPISPVSDPFQRSELEAIVKVLEDFGMTI